MVVPVPVAIVIQRQKEQIGAFELFEHLLSMSKACQCVTEVACESVQQSSRQQESPYDFWLVGRHFMYEIIHDIAMISSKLGD